jgi:hypothetical protein
MDSALAVPIAFLAVSLLTTFLVARALLRGSRAFLAGASRSDPPFGGALGGLLVVGFVLVNLGMVALQVRIGPALADGATVIEAVSQRMGSVLLVLGGTFFLLLLVLGSVRRATLEREALPPFAPERTLSASSAGPEAS